MAQQIPFETVLTALCDETRGFSARYIEHLSDLSPANLQAVLKAWPVLSQKRKRSLLKQMAEHYAEDDLLFFDDLAAELLTDPDGEIRIQALRLLAETDNPRLISPLLQIAASDPQESARQAAVALLGNFVELGELDELSPALVEQVQTGLFEIYANASASLQRTTLESLGYADLEEVTALIHAALNRHDPHWLTSALIAIGRSANPRWEEEVILHLDDINPDVRRAAVVAVGELRLSIARQPLLDLLEEEEEDEVILALIWSLSQIGGEDVRDTLQTLLDDAEEAEEEDLAEYIEDALLNLDFTEDSAGPDLLALDPDDEETVAKKYPRHN